MNTELKSRIMRMLDFFDVAWFTEEAIKQSTFIRENFDNIEEITKLEIEFDTRLKQENRGKYNADDLMVFSLLAYFAETIKNPTEENLSLIEMFFPSLTYTKVA